MSGYILSPESQEDIFEIWSYLAVEAGVELANQVVGQWIVDASLTLGWYLKEEDDRAKQS